MLQAYKNALLLAEELALELADKCDDPLHVQQVEEIRELLDTVAELEKRDA
jgi:hypothetical protein